VLCIAKKMQIVNSQDKAPTTKVVIVDDSPLIASRLSQQLSAFPLIEIKGVATNIAGALQMIEVNKPDVVILDIYLKEDAPASSGITLLSTLRQLYPQLQVIMLTNLSGEAYSNKCKELGANFFLDKSSDFEKIPELLLQIHQMANTPWPWVKETKVK
jgi:DNA-binding NarL/FixJ family response regulator